MVQNSGHGVEFTLYHTTVTPTRATGINTVIAWRIRVVTLLGGQVSGGAAQLMFACGGAGFLRDRAIEFGPGAPERLRDAVRLVSHLGACRGRTSEPDPGARSFGPYRHG